MHRGQRQIVLSKPKRKDTPAYCDSEENRIKHYTETMEIPEIIVESKDSDCDSGIKDFNDSNVATPTTSNSNPGSPRFIVNPVTSSKNSEETTFQFDKTLIAKDHVDGEKDEKLLDKKIKHTDDCDAQHSKDSSTASLNSLSAKVMNREKDELTVETESAASRKTSDTRSHDSQPKSRKVSFLGDGQRNAQFYLPTDLQPGYLYVPSPAHSRKVSMDSFYGQQPSRKSSLNAFYYPGPAGIPGLPHHKISVFSMQSVDSDRTFTDTHEVLPHEDHYRDLSNVFDLTRRPTLFELREAEKVKVLSSSSSSLSSPSSSSVIFIIVVSIFHRHYHSYSSSPSSLSSSSSSSSSLSSSSVVCLFFW